ncbi:MAG: ABC transporter permease [Bacteroidota bacterium]
MFKTYLKVAFRKLKKNKLYSFVNIAGLTVGITSCMLIGLYITHELSYDRFNEKADRIVRVTTERNGGSSITKYATTGTKVGPQLQRIFPAVESFTRTMKSSLIVSAGTEKTFDEKNVLFADADFFHIFSFHLLRGNAVSVLDGKNKVVLTESTAKKYFPQDAAHGNGDLIGKTLHIGSADYEITGISADVPANSQVQYAMVISFASLSVSKEEKWSEANYVTYLLLHSPSQIKSLEQQEIAYMQSPAIKKDYDADANEYLIFHLEPLLNVHLHSLLDGLEPNANIMYVYVLGIVALLILIIACVNYTNLAIAQSSARSIEIGVRKVLGAKRKQLFGQFIGEAGMIVFAALVLSAAISVALLPLFNSISGQSFTQAAFLRPVPIFCILFFGAVISFISGAYPALVLSNTRLTSILKSGFHLSSSGGSLRKTLIVFQFVVSIFLMIATVIILQQLSFIKNKDIGYSKGQVIVLPIDSKIRAQYQSLKNVIEQNTQIKSVSGAYETPVFVQWGDYASADATGVAKKKLSVNAMPVQLDFIKTLGMHIVAGTDFTQSDIALMDTSNDYKNFRRAYIVNEKAARDFGWTPEEALGKTIYKGAPGIIKGVVKDFNYSSVHEAVGDMILFPDTSQIHEMYVSVQGKNMTGSIAFLQSVWKERIQHRPFEYRFLDDDYNALYITEQHSAQLFSVFSLIAILLACLGLFALAAYATIQRTKEIGIRKVLGANVASITALVSKEFLQLVCIAIVIASPLAWYASQKWLDDFAYRINIQPWVFAAAGVCSLLIASGTVGFHAVKAAMMNPVKSLRME